MEPHRRSHSLHPADDLSAPSPYGPLAAIRWPAILGLAGLASTLVVLAFYLFYPFDNPSRSMGALHFEPRELRMVAYTLLQWAPWLALWRSISALGRRKPIWDGDRFRIGDLGWHLVIGVVIGFGFRLYHSILQAVIFPPLRTRSLWENLFPVYREISPAMTIFFLAIGAVPYLAVLAMTRAWHYYRAVQERELQLTRARMAALRAQIHPHFLFNTLHSVSTLMEDDVDGARRMIAQLGELLRASLADSPGEVVPLDDEMALVRMYLEIEEVRFGDRLAVDVEVDPVVRRASVPHLLLQPLVENAIRHGIGARSGPGRLAMRAHADQDQLVLEIEDDGPGPGRFELPARTAERGGATGHPEGAGLGLANVRERLERLYGDAASLELLGLPDGGCRATVRLPLHTWTEPR